MDFGVEMQILFTIICCLLALTAADAAQEPPHSESLGLQ
jgi:hypothetical protein